MTRYIVCAGSMSEIESWRQEKRLSRCEVIPVTPRNARSAIRGLSGDFELVTFESWSSASAEVLAGFEHDLAIVRMTQAARA